MSEHDQDARIDIEFEEGDFLGGHIFVAGTKFVFLNPDPAGTDIYLGEPLNPDVIIFYEKIGERPAALHEIHTALRALRKRFPDRDLFIRMPRGLQKVEPASVH